MSDPRRPGGRYYCSYWRRTYTVLARQIMGGSWIRIRWDDTGQVVEHYTAWDYCDIVLSQPA